MANEATVRVSQSVSFGAGTIGGVVGAVVAEEVVYFAKELAASTTHEIGFAIDVSDVKVAAMECTQDVTVKTNNSTSPDDTIALKANQPLIWRFGDPTALFLTVDTTKLFVIVGGTAATFKAGVGLEATP
jgi:1,4-dihydroxy-2-naphthoyl-CoA synthase